MENIDKSKRGSLFKFEVWVSLVLLVVTLWIFAKTTGVLTEDAEDASFALKFFMLAMIFISILILLMNNARKITNNPFLWIAVWYAFVALFSTLICGLYPVEQMPFRFVRMSYWVWVLIISYYSVLHLNTLKFHVFIVGVFLPVLFYSFFVVSITFRDRYGDSLISNPVFYITFLLPAILLIRKNTLKISGVLLIFVATLMSYKRSSFLAFITSVPVYVYARNVISTSAKLRKLVRITFGGVFLIVLLVFTFNYISGAIGLDWTGRLESLADDKGSGRIDIYEGYIDLLGSQSSFQWIIGNGHLSSTKTKFRRAHNDIIEVMYSFGLIGLMFYLLFIGQLAKIFFEMKKYKYIHFDAFAVSLVIFFWGSMFSMLITDPFWFLNLAFFWGWVIADFHNAKRFGDPARIVNPL